ncbi:hypothetical protein SMICM17S_03647 [Streptomyces microflavus]
MASPVDPPIYSALLRHWRSSGADRAGPPRPGVDPGRRASRLVDRPLRVSGSATREVARDDHALDLVGAFHDLQHLGLAHQPLDREVERVAVAASAWTASVVTRMAASVQKSFAMAAWREKGSPASRSRAASR